MLSRKRGERILIDDDIIVEVVEIRGDKVRIKVTAPDSIGIVREEIRNQLTRGSWRRPLRRPSDPREYGFA